MIVLFWLQAFVKCWLCAACAENDSWSVVVVVSLIKDDSTTTTKLSFVVMYDCWPNSVTINRLYMTSARRRCKSPKLVTLIVQMIDTRRLSGLNRKSLSRSG